MNGYMECVVLLVEHGSAANSGDVSGEERGRVKTKGDITSGT